MLLQNGIVHLHWIGVFLGVSLLATSPARGDEPKPTPQQARQAVEKGLAFLEKDALQWRKDRQCATCHHGVMTLWALSEAKQQGFAVREESLAEMVVWSKGRFFRPPDKADKVMPLALGEFLFAARGKLPGVSAEEINELEARFIERQDADGSWVTPPPANGPVPVFESREVFTLWAYLILERYVPADPEKPSAARASREKAAVWLNQTQPGNTTQAAALRLLVEVRAGKTAEQLQPGIDRLLARQNSDGGWSQIKELPSDAFASGQALYVLSQAGVKGDRKEVQNALLFLIANQMEDGSWPMTPRSTPQRKPSGNVTPIIHFGSAWATLGLMRWVPK